MTEFIAQLLIIAGNMAIGWAAARDEGLRVKFWVGLGAAMLGWELL